MTLCGFWFAFADVPVNKYYMPMNYNHINFYFVDESADKFSNGFVQIILQYFFG